MAKYILPIEFVLDAPNEADAMAHGRELASLLYQQNAVDYYLLGQPRPVEAPEAAPRAQAASQPAAPAPGQRSAPQPAMARRR